MSPFLALLLLAVADAGRMFFTYLEVVHAARAGAQYGAQDFSTANDNAGMQTYATNSVPNFTPLKTPVATNYCCCPAGSGSSASCTKFGSTTSTTFEESCGVTPPCADWRRYEQVNTSATFNTLVKWPGIPSTITFNSQCLLRAR